MTPNIDSEEDFSWVDAKIDFSLIKKEYKLRQINNVSIRNGLIVVSDEDGFEIYKSYDQKLVLRRDIMGGVNQAFVYGCSNLIGLIPDEDFKQVQSSPSSNLQSLFIWDD